jgi:hypothetical protein
MFVFSIRTERVRFIVESVALVAVNSHVTISLSINNSSSVWTINRKLVVVSSESVSVSINIGEKSSLEHLVHGGLNTRD